MTSNKLLTPAEAAARLGVSPVTIRNWAQKGDLVAHVTAGGHRRFTEAELRRFARSNNMTFFPLATETQRILVVEDDRQFAAFIKDALAMLDPPPVVEMAYDGFEAGRRLQGLQPDFVLLDLMLPGVDGFSICRRLRSDPETRAVRIIAMTGYDTPENVTRILDDGAEACLSKPFGVDQLLDAIAGTDRDHPEPA